MSEADTSFPAADAPTKTGSRVIYYTASSLDGFLATPDHSLDWLLQFGNVPGGDYPEFIANVGAVAMGGNTFRWLLEHEVMPPGGEAKPWPYEQPTWVFTSRPPSQVPGADIRFASGSVMPVHAEMLAAAGGKDLWVVGGGELAAQFFDAGLLDELNVTYAPALLGAGTPLFPRSLTYPRLQLIDSRSYGGVFVQSHYRILQQAPAEG